MKYHSAVIFVRDIEVSKNFYTRHLGFSIKHDYGKNVILSQGLTIWEIIPGHVIETQLGTGAEINRFELYFETDSIDTKYREFENAGFPFLHPLHEEPWGQKTFRFFDPDRNLIEVGESVEAFVINLSKRGMTGRQISRKTGIPVSEVQALLDRKD
jgi:catechol 2,3-dioxygenase-like lactoylglutathione lyase family enzyme